MDQMKCETVRSGAEWNIKISEYLEQNKTFEDVTGFEKLCSTFFTNFMDQTTKRLLDKLIDRLINN